jgi:hypothetical protein
VGSALLALGSLACRSVLGIDDGAPLASAIPSDAGADEPAGDAGAEASFCASNAAWFCADFDVAPDVAAGWDDATLAIQRTANGGTLTFDEEHFTSAPRGARMFVKRQLVGDKTLSHLQKSLPKGVRNFRIDASLRIETEGFTDDRGVYTLVQLVFLPNGGLTVSRGQRGTYLDSLDLNGSAPKQNSVLLTQTIDVGKPYPIRIFVELPSAISGPGSIEIYVDGISGGAVPITYSLTAGSDPILGLGINGQGPIQDTAVSFDDVRIEVIQ